MLFAQIKNGDHIATAIHDFEGEQTYSENVATTSQLTMILMPLIPKTM